jgi:hypothetical protein
MSGKYKVEFYKNDLLLAVQKYHGKLVALKVFNRFVSALKGLNDDLKSKSVVKLYSDCDLIKVENIA